MKIAIPAVSNKLPCDMDEKFGRAMFFAIYDTDKGSFEFVENPGNVSQSGASIKAIQVLKDKGVNLLLANHIGPKAKDLLEVAMIEFKEGFSGDVESVVSSYLES